MIRVLRNISFIILLFNGIGSAQTYISGETYFGNNDYIEYKAGKLPIIISAPHGGSLQPNSIPDRNCSGCVYVKDSFTEELIRAMYDAIENEFGCYPHVVINRLHRLKLDANRAIGDAADGDVQSEQAWADFHEFIDIAKDTITANYGKGIYLDLHGHGHTIQRLELGYLISKSELQLSDATLDQPIYINDASIVNLVNDNINYFSLSTLLRGENSFGELYESENFPAVPSFTQPYPENSESYFSGGYNTQRHGSQEGGTIDGIQIECNMDGVRNNNTNRQIFAAATARVLREYLEQHYFGQSFLDVDCNLFTSIQELEKSTTLDVITFPNPVGNYLTIEIKTPSINHFSISIVNELGQVVIDRFSDKKIFEISTTGLSSGVYFLKIKSGHLTKIRKLIK